MSVLAEAELAQRKEAEWGMGRGGSADSAEIPGMKTARGSQEANWTLKAG